MDSLIIADDIFVGYVPDRGLLYAAIDGSKHCAELTQALYDRVRSWTVMKKVILGEGYVREFETHHYKYPASVSIFAPVASVEDTTRLNTGLIKLECLNDQH